ncbi:MAG: hypothetical protein JNK76_03120 [Planctomycetales bacterium]|nr:hypothetical protein [Planctomycetales bacterium]MBN8625519.1 hypothetical protein [Planctomycetota bacterium]
MTRLLFVTCWWGLACIAPCAAAELRPVGKVVDFADATVGPYQRGYLEHFRWPEEIRQRAQELSRIEVTADSELARNVLRVNVGAAVPFEFGPLIALRLAPFYPPEADVLRLRVRAVSGKVRLYVGGPTAYFANSDVFSAVQELPARDGDNTWRNLDFSLNHPLRRNDRRAGFSAGAPRNYYNRWAQEPLGLYVDAGSRGEFLLEAVELLNAGEGRPFPQFNADDVKSVRPIADFAADGLRSAFTLYMADRETEWFAHSWTRDRPLRFTPAKLSLEPASGGGGKALVAVGPSAEEVHCFGVRTTGAAEADALRMTVTHDAPGYRNTVVGLGRAEAIDVLLFVAPPDQEFPWQSLGPSEELRKHAGPGFDYQLSYSQIRDRDDLHFAIYHARRYVKPREPTTLFVPTADFTCIYGSGSYRRHFTEHLPASCGDVIAVAWLNPWCRTGDGRSEVRLTIERPEFVDIPGEPRDQRSFWQLDRAADARMIDEPEAGGRRWRTMRLPGDM